MKSTQILTIVALFVGLYLLYAFFMGSRTEESFTSADLELANKILTYMQSPNNFIGYVNLLVENQNVSTNLPNVATYNALVAKGKDLTVADILSKF